MASAVSADGNCTGNRDITTAWALTSSSGGWVESLSVLGGLNVWPRLAGTRFAFGVRTNHQDDIDVKHSTTNISAVDYVPEKPTLAWAEQL